MHSITIKCPWLTSTSNQTSNTIKQSPDSIRSLRLPDVKLVRLLRSYLCRGDNASSIPFNPVIKHHQGSSWIDTDQISDTYDCCIIASHGRALYDIWRRECRSLVLWKNPWPTLGYGFETQSLLTLANVILRYLNRSIMKIIPRLVVPSSWEGNEVRTLTLPKPLEPAYHHLLDVIPPILGRTTQIPSYTTLLVDPSCCAI